MFVEWKQPFRFFVVLACGWITGLLIAKPGWFSCALFALFAIGSLSLGVWMYNAHGRGRRLTLFFCALGVAGAMFTWYEEKNVSQWPSSFDRQQVLLSGRIVSNPDVDGDRLSFVGEVTAASDKGRWQPLRAEKIQCSVRLRSQTEQKRAQQLQRYQGFVALIRLERPSIATNPGGFSYADYLHHQRIHWLGKVEHLAQLRLSAAPTRHPLVLIDSWREQVKKRIEQLFPAPVDGLVQSMVVGERKAVVPPLEEMYTLSGIVHLLSISGLHVSLLIACGYALGIRLRLTRETTALILLVLLPFYVLFTGAEPPVVRAGLMSGMSLLAIYFGAKQELLSLFSFALWLQLGWNPYQLWEPGFLLSYLITGMLIVVGPRLSRERQGLWRRCKQALLLAILAELTALPVIISYFYLHSPFAWLGDVLFVPVLTLLLYPASLLTLGLSLLWPSLAADLAALLAKGLTWIHQLLFALKPLFLWQASWAKPSWLWLILYAFTLVLTVLLWQSRHPRFTGWHRSLVTGALVVLLVYAHLPAAVKEQETRLTFLDVGQGDSIVLETASGRVMVIDGGGQQSFARQAWQRRRQPYDVGQRVVQYLRYRGIQTIDDLVLTHGDFDHLGGLHTVSEQLNIKRVVRNDQPLRSAAERRLVALWQRRRIPIYQVDTVAQETWAPGLQVRFYNPARWELKQPVDANDASLCIELLIEGQRILLTGDIEASGEGVLRDRLPAQPALLLKVAHHGSRTSSTAAWLDHIRPAHAVISVGRDNRFGHPALEVLARLRERGARIWRTDEHGAITFRFTPQGYAVETMLPSESEAEIRKRKD